MTTRTEMPMLLAQSGPVNGQRWLLTKDEVTIGRGQECDVVIADRQVSRVHARLRRGAAGFVVEDLQSKNGTHLNGAPVSGAPVLQDGDVIQIALVARLMYVGSEATMPLRLDGPPGGAAVPATGWLRLDKSARRAWLRDTEIDPPLSVPQFRFLELLFDHPGAVCTREQVVETVWPEAVGGGVSEQAIDALVRRLRDRLAEIDSDHQYVATVRGHGFRLDNRPL